MNHFDDLTDLIASNNYLRKQVQTLTAQAKDVAFDDEEERAFELGKAIEEIFTRAVPLLPNLDTDLEAVGRLVHRYFDHVDAVDLGAYYLRLADEGVEVPVGEGYLELFHRTSDDAASAIARLRRFESREQHAVYFSDQSGGQYVVDYGEACVRVIVPAHLAELDDEFQTGERHYRVDARQIHPDWITVLRPVR